MTQLALPVNSLTEVETDALVKHLGSLRLLGMRLRLNVPQIEDKPEFVSLMTDLDQCIERASRLLLDGRNL